MGIDVDTGSTTFDRARRQRRYRRLRNVLAGRTDGLLELDRVERALRPYGPRQVGIQSIPLDQIVGTDSRAADFDRSFLPRRPEIRSRWRSVERAFPHGDFPPIVVTRLGEAYFVVDGHHRVAVARQLGMETIDAHVTELRARWHLEARADIHQLEHAEQHRLFLDQSGLGLARPKADFRFTRPIGYRQLLEEVQLHGYHLMLDTGRALTRDEVAADWYDGVYLRALDTFHREGIVPLATDADMFLCVAERRRATIPADGLPLPLAVAARQLLDEDEKRRRALAHLLVASPRALR